MCNLKILTAIGKLVRNVYTFYFIMFIPVIIVIAKNIKYIVNMNKEI